MLPACSGTPLQPTKSESRNHVPSYSVSAAPLAKSRIPEQNGLAPRVKRTTLLFVENNPKYKIVIPRPPLIRRNTCSLWGGS